MRRASRQPRVHTRTTVRLRDVASGVTRRVGLENLSWGGALLRCDTPPGISGDQVEIRLPYHSGLTIPIRSEIVRIEEPRGSPRDVAVRFTCLSLSDEERLQNMLESLLHAAVGNAVDRPRLTQLLDVYSDDTAEIRITLEDIAEGELAMTVPTGFATGESVLLSIFGGSRFGAIKLRARVTRQAQVREVPRPVFRIFLAFEHPRDELRVVLKRTLGSITMSTLEAGRDGMGPRPG